MRKYNIASDLVLVKSIQPVVYKQFDNGDNLVVELYQDGDKIVLSTEQVLAFFQLLDGTVIQKNCSIVDGNAVATLDNNILSQSGSVKAEFTIYSGTTETTTRTLLITVEQSINRNEAIKTIPQWDIVQQVLELKPSLDVAEETRQGQEAERQTNTTNAINSLNTAVNNLQLIYKSPVANFSAIATTYPKPSIGWAVQTLDDGKIYRYDGTTWQFFQQITNNAITAIQNNLSDANRQSQVLQHGVSVINASMDSPVDVEIQGRTLVSLGQSNLEGGKSYVLADKKTKVRTDGRNANPVQGVAKFQKSASLTTKADFSGKVGGSVMENPHLASAVINATALTTTLNTENFGTSYSKLLSLDTNVQVSSNSAASGIAQHRFSFNIIEQIERNMGRIPKNTVAEKVQWLKDNVNQLTGNWYGFGTSVGGNKASCRPWYSTDSSWRDWGLVNTTGVINKLTFTIANSSFVQMVDSNGFIHLLAYAEPSDGITPSIINTDYVELVITLNSTAQLDTRPILIRTANFEGKVLGSTVEVPHTFKRSKNNESFKTLISPTSFGSDREYAPIEINKLDSLVNISSTNVSNCISQHLFSFDIIQAIERNIGRIPKATLAEKVQWCRDNVASMTANWYGFGSSVGGNKASFSIWAVNTSAWTTPQVSTSGAVAKVAAGSTNASIRVDTTGFVHFIAYAEPSDGTTPSTINTDYIELEIELKPEAVLHDPLVPLYEVDSTEYSKILVDWNEVEVLNRYPRVQGVQHLQNPYVLADGKNKFDGQLEAGDISVSTGVKQTGSGTSRSTNYHTVVVNKQYFLSGLENTGGLSNMVYFYDSDKNYISNFSLGNSGGAFTTPSNCKYILFRYGSNNVNLNIQLELGSSATPFSPQNPSYLFAQTKLGQIGSAKDMLYKQDGQWNLRKMIEKDVVLDGSLGWRYVDKLTGYKAFGLDNVFSFINDMTTTTKYDGKMLKVISASVSANTTSADQVYDSFTSGSFYYRMTVSNTDTGFGETYTPTVSEIQAYFYGWQAKTVDGNGKPTTWRSLGDDTDAPTQTLAYVSGNKAPNYTPYKLSYVLANPQIINVSDKVEGDIAVNGLTQVEVGSGFSSTIIDGKINRTITPDILRYKETVNATEIKVSFDSSLKSVVDSLVERQADIVTQQSIHIQALAEVYKRLKALGG